MSSHICGERGEKAEAKRSFKPLEGDMCLSPDKKYRYSLTTRWGPGPTITWVMFNPAGADLAETPGFIIPDRTINRIVAFSKKGPKRFGSLSVVNLFAWRDTCPACTLCQPDPIGDNNEHLSALLEGVNAVAIAWGSLHGLRTELRAKAENRVREVNEVLGHIGRLCLCKVDSDSSPGHPLYLSGDLRLVDWESAPSCQ